MTDYCGKRAYIYGARNEVVFEPREPNHFERSFQSFFSPLLNVPPNEIDLLFGAYADHRDSCGFHQDHSQATVTLSLGDTRKLVLKDNQLNADPHCAPLQHGDICIMKEHVSIAITYTFLILP